MSEPVTVGTRQKGNCRKKDMKTKMEIQLPERVNYIIECLEKNGYEAYAVGGCVRDSLLGKEPTDWDICTSALPEETERVFSGERIIETGLQHGTVTVLIDRIGYEVTTFRTESGYSDFRRPDSVSFVKNVAEDLKRRDFTVNAMAYNKKDGLIDIYGGRRDLKNRLIKCVGEPHERFCEDALRIMRAVRFGGVLGFDIETKTAEAVRNDRLLLKNIAAERISAEFIKLLMSGNPEIIYEYREVIAVFADGAERLEKSDCMIIGKLPPKKSLRLAFFMNCLYKNSDDVLNTVHNALKKLKLDNKLTESTKRIIACMKRPLPNSLAQCRFAVSEFGHEAVSDCAIIGMISKAETGNAFKEVLRQLDIIERDGLCTEITGLDINGNDLMNIGITDGKQIGMILKLVLKEVIEENLKNEKSKILSYVAEIQNKDAP